MEEDTKDAKDTREAEALFGIVSDRYGDRLNEDQLEEVRKAVDAAMELAMELRAVELDNSVEPYSTFKPYRGEGSRD